MGFVDAVGCWFPLKAKALLGDLPDDAATFGKPIGIVAQWPDSKNSWSYTFKGCHPVKRWRKPTQAELTRARHFYGMI